MSLGFSTADVTVTTLLDPLDGSVIPLDAQGTIMADWSPSSPPVNPLCVPSGARRLSASSPTTSPGTQTIILSTTLAPANWDTLSALLGMNMASAAASFAGEVPWVLNVRTCVHVCAVYTWLCNRESAIVSTLDYVITHLHLAPRTLLSLYECRVHRPAGEYQRDLGFDVMERRGLSFTTPRERGRGLLQQRNGACDHRGHRCRWSRRPSRYSCCTYRNSQKEDGSSMPAGRSDRGDSSRAACGGGRGWG